MTSYIKNIPNVTEKPHTDMTWDNLFRANRAIPVPFSLSLTDTDKKLYCDEVIRIIPGKRLVAFGRWGDLPVVVKCFYEPKQARRHANRDASGIMTLLTSGIPSPKLYYQGGTPEEQIHVLIFEKINGARNLLTLWQEKKDHDDLNHAMHAVTLELATQHVLGILQHDLHLKNFLITHNQIFTLDGSDVEKREGPLSKADSLNHLGLFFAQLGVGTEELQQTLFHTYSKARGWIVKPYDRELLAHGVQKNLKQRLRRYQKKISRDCSAFGNIKTSHEWIMYDRDYQSAAFSRFLQDPDATFRQSSTQILKNGGSSTVAKITLDNRMLIVKRYNIKNFSHGLRRAFRPSRAVNSWRLAQYLSLVGIPTAKPVACIEKRTFGLRGKSYFIMEYIDGIHAGEYFAHYHTNDLEAQKTAKNILTIFENLAQLKLTHGDLKMTNILITPHSPILIDLDGMQHHATLWGLKKAYQKELQRFMKNWQNKPKVHQLFTDLLNKNLP